MAAFTDGRSPKIRPISMENTTEPIMAGMLMAVGAPDTCATTFDRMIPSTTPMTVSYTHLSVKAANLNPIDALRSE